MDIICSSTSKRTTLPKDKVTIYVCGPTVYNHIHIGNIRPILTFDVLHRFLKYQGVNVKFVHNITDIDDKILKAAKEEGIHELEYSNFYTKKYLEILEKMNILPVEIHKVSENMDDMVAFISKLLDKGFAYKLNDGIYLDVSKINSYGNVSNMNIDKLESGKRIEVDDNKKNQNDFCLWKIKTDGILWDSPYGKGRPGWHTECVVLIDKFIKDTVNVHGGGIDLRFPHHENENAQYVALYNKPLADTWMHVGHLTIDNEKMSKSLGNFILMKDIIDKWGSNTIRWFFYQVNYQKPLNYTADNVQNAKKDIERIFLELNKAKTYLIIHDALNETKYLDDNKLKCFEDNLNFPNIVSSIQQDVKKFSVLIKDKNWDELNKIRNSVNTALSLLGIKNDEAFNDDVIKKIKQWNQHVQNKEFDKADELRKLLMSKAVM